MSTIATTSVIIQASPHAHITDIAAQMLRMAGFEIIEVDTIEAACDRLHETHVELLVIHGTHAQVSSGLDRISTLHADDRPERIAILSDDDCDDTSLSRKVPGTKVHLFVAQLQAFGLLNVVRRIRRQHAQLSN